MANEAVDTQESCRLRPLSEALKARASSFYSLSLEPHGWSTKEASLQRGLEVRLRSVHPLPLTDTSLLVGLTPGAAQEESQRFPSRVCLPVGVSLLAS